jgi:hypothetical protein
MPPTEPDDGSREARHHGPMRPRSRGPFPVVLAVVLALGALLAPPAARPAGAATREFRMDLLGRGDFVTQYTDVACVGASVQMMLNIIDRGADRSPATQARALRTAQQMSNPIFVRRYGGASALGWAYATERLGGGPYRVRSFSTRAAALRAVATAIRTTGRPAGLLVWQGAHAWVVSGFRSSVDPAAPGGFRLRGLVVNDPWWPRSVGGRGRTVAPGTEMSPAALAGHFVRFQRGPRSRTGSILNGGFVVVLPIDPAIVEARAAGML